ncbi:MAG: host attachment protein [Bdellovibrionales bacterium]|nr:host attachment protein [Bdellovibrionales bacterium]
MRTQAGNYFRNQIHSRPAHRTWYVLANRSDAVFYEDHKDQKFKFKERLKNRKGHLTEGQLDSDRPGSGFSSAGGGTIRHGLDRTFQHHERVASAFANVIANLLARRKREGALDALILVAEPHFLGLLRKALPKDLQSLIRHEIPREYLEGSDEDLKNAIERAILK